MTSESAKSKFRSPLFVVFYRVFWVSIPSCGESDFFSSLTIKLREIRWKYQISANSPAV